MKSDFTIRCLHHRSEDENLGVLKKIGVDDYGLVAMLPKMSHLNIYMETIPCRTANIIKQEMLSIGGDAAVSKDSVACMEDNTDVLIMGTVKEVRLFIQKIQKQPFGLHRLSQQLKTILSNITINSYEVTTPRRKIILKDRTLLMGIVNVTPDSFSDGGCFFSLEDALDHGCMLADEGADILDIGGESSRPGSEPIPLEEEIRRVVPVVEKLVGRIDIPISVDTCKAEVARRALQAGAEIVNDISALRFDPGMAGVAASFGAAVILMHMRGTPKTMQLGDLSYRSLTGEIIIFLRERIDSAVQEGIPEESIILDPGMGFGKSSEDNLRILKYLPEFKVIGRPLLI
ncbi:MAG: dihydropteroate synthase, partial [Syntrophales bacterium]